MKTSSTLSSRRSSRRAGRPILLMICFIALGLPAYSLSAEGEPAGEPKPFAVLKSRLLQDGLKASLVEPLYGSPEVAFDQGCVSAYFMHREASLNYDQFLSDASIAEAEKYMRRHKKALDKTEGAYGVPAEVITAILLVETRLGTYVGKRLVINSLSSLSALDDEETREWLWNDYVKDRGNRTREQFDSWALRKSAWAYKELKAFLTYIDEQGVDPFTMPGSYAGALGYAQFIPSSVLQYAQDGNDDGRTNLYHHEDAIESIANYLSKHGWRPSLGRDQYFKIILTYNNSKYYAETILAAADRLEKSHSKP